MIDVPLCKEIYLAEDTLGNPLLFFFVIVASIIKYNAQKFHFGFEACVNLPKGEVWQHRSIMETFSWKKLALGNVTLNKQNVGFARLIFKVSASPVTPSVYSVNLPLHKPS